MIPQVLQEDSRYTQSMNLIALDLLAHTLSSITIGILFWQLISDRKKKTLFWCVFYAFLTGLFVDVDHLVDYFHAYGFIWNMQLFFQAKYFAQTGYNFVPLHGFEYVLILGFITHFIKDKNKKLYIMILASSLFIHLCIDIFIGGVPSEEYFILFRLWHGFHSM